MLSFLGIKDCTSILIINIMMLLYDKVIYPILYPSILKINSKLEYNSNIIICSTLTNFYQYHQIIVDK